MANPKCLKCLKEIDSFPRWVSYTCEKYMCQHCKDTLDPSNASYFLLREDNPIIGDPIVYCRECKCLLTKEMTTWFCHGCYEYICDRCDLFHERHCHF